MSGDPSQTQKSDAKRAKNGDTRISARTLRNQLEELYRRSLDANFTNTSRMIELAIDTLTAEANLENSEHRSHRIRLKY